jgi:hypothetical protein
MSVWSDRLSWVGSYKSYASLSRDYSIPYRTVLAAKTTGIIPSDYRPAFESLWSKETYSIARSEQVPVYSSSAIRGGSLETVLTEINIWKGVFDGWATGAIGSKYLGYDRDKWGSDQWAQYWVVRNKIAESSQQSNLRAAEAQDRNSSM